MTPTESYNSKQTVNVGTEGHIDHGSEEAAQQIELTPEMIQQLMAMQGRDKRGITKPRFNKTKRKARNKVAKASRKANR